MINYKKLQRSFSDFGDFAEIKLTSTEFGLESKSKAMWMLHVGKSKIFAKRVIIRRQAHELKRGRATRQDWPFLRDRERGNRLFPDWINVGLVGRCIRRY